MENAPPCHVAVKRQHNVLLLGETGSGKSTLINYFTNVFLGGSPPNNLRIAIATKYFKQTERFASSEAAPDDETKSQTKECTTYSFRDQNGNQFNFVDTPGLSDTEGFANDDRHVDKVMKAAEGVGNLSAIVIIINGTVSRLTANMKNVLARLQNSTPDELLRNIIVVLTKCTKANANFKVDGKTLGSMQPSKENVFYMDNSYFTQNPVDSDPEVKEELLYRWGKSMDVMKKLLDRIAQLRATSTRAYSEMIEKRNKIKSQMQGILLEIQRMQQVEDQLQGARTAHPEIVRNADAYKDWKTKKEVTTYKMVDSESHNTLCLVHAKTGIICHEGCGLGFIENAGDDQFKGCACMSSANCTKCPEKCGHVNHYHDKKKPAQTTQTIDEILYDKKATHERLVQQKEDLESKISSFETELKDVQSGLAANESEIKRLCAELKTICRQFNFVDELNSVVQMLETEKRALRNQNTRDNAEKMIRNIRSLAQQLTSSSGN